MAVQLDLSPLRGAKAKKRRTERQRGHQEAITRGQARLSWPGRRTTDNCCPAWRINDCQPADTDSRHEYCALEQWNGVDERIVLLRRSELKGYRYSCQRREIGNDALEITREFIFEDGGGKQKEKLTTSIRLVIFLFISPAKISIDAFFSVRVSCRKFLEQRILGVIIFCHKPFVTSMLRDCINVRYYVDYCIHK